MQEVEVNSTTASEIKKPEPPPPQPKTLQVLADDRGRLIGKTMDEQARVANMLLQSGKLRGFESVAIVMVGMQYALELGLNPVTALRQMYHVHGTISIYGDLPLAIVESKGLIAEHEEFLIDKDFNKICLENKNLLAEPWAAVCRTKRKGRSTYMETFFTVDQAEKAQLMRNPTWQKYRGDMLTYRARSRNLKSNFADALAGVAIAEYDFNEMPSARDVSPESQQNSALDSINKLVAKEVGA